MSNKGLVNFLWAQTYTYGTKLKELGNEEILYRSEKNIAEAKKEILRRMSKKHAAQHY